MKTGSSSPQITGSHSLGMINSGPIAIAVRKPSRSESIILSGGDWSEERKASSASQCHAPDGDSQIDHRCLGLLIKGNYATASGIGKGAHAAAAPFTDNCRCHDLWSDADGTAIGTDWAEGFMQGVALRAAKWERLFRSEDGASLIFPILALCGARTANLCLASSRRRKTASRSKQRYSCPAALWRSTITGVDDS